MARELINAQITHVSYVDKGANQKKFFLTKSEDTPVFEKTVKILIKEEDPQKLVYGVVYEPNVEDAHDDFMTEAEIEKAAHQFLKDSRNIDTQHNFESGSGEVVESYIAPADIEIGDNVITKGSWVLVTKATDEIWDSIQKGEITGYSMAGTAEVIEKTEETLQENNTMLQKAIEALQRVFKGEVKDKFYEDRLRRDFWNAFYILDDIFWDEIYYGTMDAQRLSDAAKDLGELLLELSQSGDIVKELGGEEGIKEELQKSKRLPEQDLNVAELEKLHTQIGEIITKANTPKEEDEMNKEEMKNILKEVLDPIEAKIAELEKAQEVEEEVVEEEPKEEITADLLKTVVQEALSGVETRLTALEKSRAIPKGEEDITKEEEIESTWDGLL